MSDQSGNVIQEGSPEPAIKAPAQKPVLTRRQKLWRFLIGFLGWWLVNFLIMEAAFRYDCFGFYECSFFVSLVVVPANALVIMLLALINRWVAFGILVAFATFFVITFVGDWIYFTFFWR